MGMRMNLRIGKIAGIVCGGALALLAAGCGGDREKQVAKAVESISFEMYNYDVIAERLDVDSLESDVPGGRYVKLVGEGVIPRDNGSAGLRALRDSLLRLTHLGFAEDDRPVPDVLGDLRVTDLDADTTQACSFASNTLSASLVSPRVMVFENQSEGYMCRAAHGMEHRSFVNYDVEKGEILTLSRLMRPGFEKKLCAMIRAAVTKAELPLVVDINEVGIPRQFAVTASGITFSYDPYDIAPYSEGVVSVSVSIGDLVSAELLSPEGEYLLTGEGKRPEK